jgi:SAM-dependent methyltransferase
MGPRDIEPKPKGWASKYGAWFDEESVASRYCFRPPYPAETFELLAPLASDSPRNVLDAGCGLGDLARHLAPLVDRVDAVDRSQAMLAKGRTFPGADAANLNWIEAAIEDAPLDPPYSLIVAGDSVHWFDWGPTMKIFSDALSPRGVLALVTRDWARDPSLRARLGAIYSRHGANPDFAPLDPVDELARRGLFEQLGQRATGCEPWSPTRAELIGCHHSQNGFVLEKMRDAAEFDRELIEAVEELVPVSNGRFDLDVVATIIWGLPRAAG